jgi:hypothetical protein
MAYYTIVCVLGNKKYLKQKGRCLTGILKTIFNCRNCAILTPKIKKGGIDNARQNRRLVLRRRVHLFDEC